MPISEIAGKTNSQGIRSIGVLIAEPARRQYAAKSGDHALRTVDAYALALSATGRVWTAASGFRQAGAAVAKTWRAEVDTDTRGHGTTANAFLAQTARGPESTGPDAHVVWLGADALDECEAGAILHPFA